MKRKKRDMTHEELQRFLANKYNDYQNVNIYDSYYNYMDVEFADELYKRDLYMDVENRKLK